MAGLNLMWPKKAFVLSERMEKPIAGLALIWPTKRMG